jgi:hypothetical protein
MSTALDQTTRDDTARGVVFRDRIIDTVEFFDVIRLLRDVERLFRSGLHLRGEFVTGDARLEIKFAAMLREMILIEGLQQRELSLLRRTSKRRGRIEIQNARLGGPHERALEQRGKPAIGEMLALESRQAARMREHHVGGQFVCFAAETIRQPRTERGASSGDASPVHRVEALRVIAHAGGHRADQRDLIHHLAQVWQKLADLHAALALFFEFPWRAKALRRCLREVVVFDLTGELLAVILRQHRLRIKEVHLRRTAHHEERDHGLRARLKVRLLRCQIVAHLAKAFRLHRCCEQAIALQQRGKRHGAKTEAVGVKEMTT